MDAHHVLVGMIQAAACPQRTCQLSTLLTASLDQLQLGYSCCGAYTLAIGLKRSQIVREEEYSMRKSNAQAAQDHHNQAPI